MKNVIMKKISEKIINDIILDDEIVIKEKDNEIVNDEIINKKDENNYNNLFNCIILYKKNLNKLLDYNSCINNIIKSDDIDINVKYNENKINFNWNNCIKVDEYNIDSKNIINNLYFKENNNFITFIIPTIGRGSLLDTIESLYNLKNPLWKAIILFDGIKNKFSIKDNRITIIELDKKME